MCVSVFLVKDQQVAHSDDIVKGYTEGQKENDKYALVLKKREELGEGAAQLSREFPGAFKGMDSWQMLKICKLDE